MPIAVLGMRGSGSFTAAERPRNWRQAILLLFPNGDAPLTAVLSKLREAPTDDPQFNWFEKGLPEQRARMVGVSTTLTAAPATGTTVAANDANAYLALRLRPYTDISTTAATDDTSIYKPGHILYNQTVDEPVYVVKKASVGGVDYLIVLRNLGGKYTLGVNNPAWTGSTTDATADKIIISGSGYPEGATIGQAVAYQPIKQFNYTQIFRNAVFITRTGRKTRLRWDATGGYAENKREGLQLHAIEMEKAFLFGERSENTSLANPDAPLDITSSGQPMRTTRGLLNWMPPITSGTAPTIHYDIGVANGGALTEALLDSWFEELFRWGSKEKLLLCGSTALNVLTQMAKNKTTMESVPTDHAYGMALTRYISPFGVAYFMNHPLLSHDPTWRKDIFGVDVDMLTFRYIDDTTFLKNRQSPGDDASKDEWLTEGGLECHFSGRQPADTSDGLPDLLPASAHGRLKGIVSFGG